jgi:hypothetical protein
MGDSIVLVPVLVGPLCEQNRPGTLTRAYQRRLSDQHVHRPAPASGARGVTVADSTWSGPWTRAHYVSVSDDPVCSRPSTRVASPSRWQDYARHHEWPLLTAFAQTRESCQT